ncbi:hypothetical protein T439DRAFT_321501 [Meredithblackwellia eburnea MCA 4105]
MSTISTDTDQDDYDDEHDLYFDDEDSTGYAGRPLSPAWPPKRRKRSDEDGVVPPSKKTQTDPSEDKGKGKEIELSSESLEGSSSSLTASPARASDTLLSTSEPRLASSSPSLSSSQGFPVPSNTVPYSSAENGEPSLLAAARSRLEGHLSKLETIPRHDLSSLVHLDPSPLNTLKPSTKLIKALTMLSYFAADLPEDSYSVMVELMSSAIADVQGLEMNAKNATSDLKKKSAYSLQVARAKLALAAAGVIPPTPPASSQQSTSASSAQETSSEGPARISSNDPNPQMTRDIHDLWAENTRLALLLLRPSFLNLGAQSTVSSPTISSSPASTKSPIAKLPEELLSEILLIARSMCEERVPGSFTNASVSPPLDDPANWAYEMAVPHSRRGFQELAGSRTAGQRWVFRTSLVCKNWCDVSRRTGLRSVHLRRPGPMEKLLEFVSQGGSKYAQCITAINIKLPVVTPDPTLVGTISRRGRSHGAFGWSSRRGVAVDSTDGSSSSSLNADKQAENLTPGGLFSKLVNSTPSLRELTLTVTGHTYSIPFGARHNTTDFLETPLLDSLTSLRTLTSLTLGTSIDFEELETIILGMPLLTHLNLDGGFDDVNGQGSVSSSSPHPAKLTTLVVASGRNNYRDYTSVTDTQLAWLLEPAVATLKVFEMTIMSPGAQGPAAFGFGVGGGAGGGGNPLPPCFASGLVADLIMGMESLERLVLRDLNSFAQVNPSLNAAPHSGNLDHALSQLSRLREVTLQFSYTGPSFLDSLLPSASILETLVLFGVPVNLPAEDLISRIDSGSFTKLERLAVSGQFVGRGVGGGGWTGPEVRKLKEVCSRHKISIMLQPN